MKKVFNSIFTIATVMMAAVSCQKEQVEPASQARLLSFSGNVIETKAVLGTGSDASHYAVKWEEGDAFCVNYGAKEGATAFKTVTMSNYIGNTSAEWSVFGVQDGGKDNVLRAIYPYQENYTNISNSAKYIAFSLPAIQTPEANGPDRNAVIMYAQTAVDVEDGEVKEDVSLSFSTIVAFGRIAEITGIPVSETVKDIVISATENMVGTVVKYNYDGRENPYTITGGSNIVTITPKALTNVWFTVCPGSYSDVKITVNTLSGKVYSKTAAGDITFSADKIGKIASVAVAEEEVAPTIPSFTWDLTQNTSISQDNDSRVWDCTYAKMEQKKNSATVNVANYNPLRLYKNHALVITPKEGYKITAIEYADDMTTNYKKISTGTWTNATTEYENNVVSATVTNPTEPVTVIATEQSRLASVKIIYEEIPPVDPDAPVVTPSVTSVDNISYDGVIDDFTFTVENGDITDVTITPASNDWFEWEISGNTITYCAYSNNTNEERIFNMSLAIAGGNTAYVKFTQNARPKVATPVINCNNNEITITCSTAEALISYTLDGSTPTNKHGEVYDPSDKPKITADCTVKAIAVLDGYVDSDVAEKVCSFTSSGQGPSPIVIDFTNKGYNNEQKLGDTTYSEDFGTLTIAQGEASTEPTYYTSDTAIRFYGTKNTSKGNTLTFTPANGKKITKIGFLISTISNSGYLTANTGTYTATGSSTTEYKYWIGEVTSDGSVVFSVTNTTSKNPQVRIQKIEVTYAN